MANNTPTAAPIEPLLAGIRSSLTSGYFSDLKIFSENQEFKVHRLVVCTQSEYFYRLLGGEWAETINKEIYLKEDHPHAVEAMIRFLYGIDYDSKSSLQSSSGFQNSSSDEKNSTEYAQLSPILLNVMVYQLGDKYIIPQLKLQAKEKFEKLLKTSWAADDFPIAITEAYERTTKDDRGLRDPLVAITHEHFDVLKKRDGFNNVLETVVGFAADLIRSLPLPTGLKKCRCPSCDKNFYLESSDICKPNSYPQSRSFCTKCGNGRADWTPYLVS